MATPRQQAREFMKQLFDRPCSPGERAACDAVTDRIAELEDALGKAINYCDAATHGDEQYHDERSSLIRAYRGQ